jgi:hypothetical protein
VVVVIQSKRVMVKVVDGVLENKNLIDCGRSLFFYVHYFMFSTAVCLLFLDYDATFSVIIHTTEAGVAQWQSI